MIIEYWHLCYACTWSLYSTNNSEKRVLKPSLLELGLSRPRLREMNTLRLHYFYTVIQQCLYRTIKEKEKRKKKTSMISTSYRFHSKFLLTYQSPDTNTICLDWLAFPISYFHFLFSNIKNSKNFILQTPWKYNFCYFKDTSEVQVLIGISVGVHTRARRCKCLKLCSILTCTISASIFFALLD